jgi:hypothetical protein
MPPATLVEINLKKSCWCKSRSAENQHMLVSGLASGLVFDLLSSASCTPWSAQSSPEDHQPHIWGSLRCFLKNFGLAKVGHLSHLLCKFNL